MRFAWPTMLWLIPVIVPAMVAFFWWSNRRREQLLAGFISARLLPALLTGDSRARRRWREGLWIAGAVMLVVALARPQWGFEWQEARVRGLDILIAIDTSRSMLAEDIKPNRLARAKLAALDLMQQARSDRLGLIAFAGASFLQCPLTIDDAAFRQSVEALKVGIIPRGGTDVSGAIRTALNAFKEGENHKVLVLFTDGEETDPGALEAAQEAGKAGLKIYTVGVGTPAGEIIQVVGDDQKPDYVRDEQGNVIKSKLNEDLLREIAGAASGFYLPLKAQTIDTLYNHEKGLASLPKSESQEKLIKRYFERFHWPLGLAILLFLAEMFVPDRPRDRKPRVPAAAVAVLLILTGLPTPSRASVGSAEKHYEAGRFAEALRDYQEAIRKNPNDPRLYFNAGASAFRAGKMQEAASLFGNALSGPDLNLQQQAWYNRGNANFAHGEQDPDTKKRMETWQQSLKDFENALKLNPQDKDAEFNRDLVKKRLEELKQQQQQQQNQDQNDQDQEKKDQDQQKQDQQQNDQKQDQQQKQDKQDQQQDQSSKQSQDQQQPKPQDQQQKDQQSSSQQPEKKQDQQRSSSGQKPEDKKDGKSQQSPAQDQPQSGDEKHPAQARELTPEQAAQLLEGQEGEAKLLPVKPEKVPGNPSRPLKDY